MTLFKKSAELAIGDARNGRISLTDFREHFPVLSTHAFLDRGSPLLNLWAESKNFDENAKKQITDPKLLNAVGRLANVQIRKKHGYHAGLLHTYGYLMSSLATPYGYKHERWTNGKIESNFGLPPRTFWRGNGTLFQNVTYFFSRLASLNQSKIIKAPEHVSPTLVDFPYESLSSTCLIEQTKHREKKLCLTTRVIDGLQTDSKLLVYSIRFENRTPKLVTGFSITPEAAEEIQCENRLGKQTIRLRYNCHVDDFPAEGMPGTRTLKDYK